MNHLTDQQLNEFLDEALDASARAEVDTHLRVCNECQGRLADFQVVFDKLAGLPDSILSHDLSLGVISRLPQKPPRLWTPIFAAQVGFALGALIWLSVQVLQLIKVPPISRLMKYALFNIPTFNLQGLLSNPELLVFKIQIPVLKIPSFLALFPGFQYSISTIGVVILAITVLVLWVIGNSMLLHNHSKVQP